MKTRRSFLRSILKAVAACAFLPAVVTYARTWKPARGLLVPDLELIPFSHLKTMLYRPPGGLYDYLVGQRERQTIMENAATLLFKHCEPVRDCGKITNAKIQCATSEELAEIFRL